MLEIARECVPNDLPENWIPDVTIVSDPPGAWVEPRQVHGMRYVGGPWPFFIDREDGFVTMLYHRHGRAANEALMQWYKDGVPEAKAILMGTAGGSLLFETWVRLWLVGTNERYSRLSVPTLTNEEQKPSTPWWKFW
jgi:hypothetical protein